MYYGFRHDGGDCSYVIRVIEHVVYRDLQKLWVDIAAENSATTVESVER